MIAQWLDRLRDRVIEGYLDSDDVFAEVRDEWGPKDQVLAGALIGLMLFFLLGPIILSIFF